MLKGTEKLKGVNKFLVDWISQFDKDYNYKFSTEGVDIIITEGLRTPEQQKKYFLSGKSKTLKSKHLIGNAIDICFSVNGKINWNDMKYWVLASKHFLDYGKSKGVNIRWGGDWSGNGDWKDEKFLDAPHYEITSVVPIEKTITLDLGDKGETVKQLQELLIKKGYKLIADGDFGNKTLEAVKDFQSKNGLKVDGVVGIKTMEILDHER